MPILAKWKHKSSIHIGFIVFNGGVTTFFVKSVFQNAKYLSSNIIFWIHSPFSIIYGPVDYVQYVWGLLFSLDGHLE